MDQNQNQNQNKNLQISKGGVRTWIAILSILVAIFSISSAFYFSYRNNLQYTQNLSTPLSSSKTNNISQQTAPIALGDPALTPISILTQNLSDTSPIYWQDGDIKYTLTRVDFGDFITGSSHFLYNPYAEAYYYPGNTVHSIVLTFKMNAGGTVGFCAPLNIRRIDSSGDKVSPDIAQFYFKGGTCLTTPGDTYYNMPIVFTTPPGQSDFFFETNGDANGLNYFEVKAKNGYLSVTTILNLPDSFLSQARSRDLQRVSDIKNIGASLDSYYQANNGYPDTLNTLYSEYGVSTAPTPADGVCTNANNAYIYSTVGSGFLSPKDNTTTVYPGYKLQFCLGAASSGYAAGVHIYTSGGGIQ